MTNQPITNNDPTLNSAVTVAHIVYALHAIAIFLGISGAPTIIGSFVGSLPSIFAVLLNYIRRGDARDTWVESHYKWQIRTFWFALVWLVVAWVAIFSLVGAVVGFPMLVVLTVWLIYRVLRGWLRLRKSLPMYS
ncbi:MAG: hypothetical protein GY703_00010 [Gammaproteobacteria bacterium]|nr:hypothetical protein [Gammaproteobacteria bacterium]